MALVVPQALANIKCVEVYGDTEKIPVSCGLKKKRVGRHKKKK